MGNVLYKSTALSVLAMAGIACTAPAQAADYFTVLMKKVTPESWCPNYNKPSSAGYGQEWAFFIQRYDDSTNTTTIVYNGETVTPEEAFCIEVQNTNNCEYTSIIPNTGGEGPCVYEGEQVVAIAGQMSQGAPVFGWDPSQCPAFTGGYSGDCSGTGAGSGNGGGGTGGTGGGGTGGTGGGGTGGTGGGGTGGTGGTGGGVGSGTGTGGNYCDGKPGCK